MRAGRSAHRMRAPRLLWRALILAAAGNLATATTVGATAYVQGPLVLASGPSPFAACTVGGPGTNFPNSEIEPFVAVNPANSSNIIGVFQQDRWNNGGAHGIIAAVSHDGGATWTRTFPHFSTCAGGTAANGGNYDRSSDPWITFAPNGDAYFISLSASADLLTSAVLVSKSTNGGDTWSEPATLISERSAFHFNDKESITADPTNASLVYAVWDRSRFPSENADFNALHSSAFRGPATFSRTTNGGQTWSTPRDIMPTNANLFSIGNQIAVLPDGSLVDVFELFHGSGKQPSPNQFTESLMRSTDKGLTWSSVIDISTDMSVPVRDPDTGAPVRAGEGLPDVAVDRTNGTIYVVWSDSRFSSGLRDDVALSKSVDGGNTWSTPTKVNRTPVAVAAFTPSVEVAADGTVGVFYYDFRNNTPAPGALTDAFLAHSHDGGATWQENRLTPTSFDIEQAPVARGFFLGDYVGLTSVGATFMPFFTQAVTMPANPTDVFFTTVAP
jgi:BNR repeat-like domain